MVYLEKPAAQDQALCARIGRGKVTLTLTACFGRATYIPLASSHCMALGSLT